MPHNLIQNESRQATPVIFTIIARNYLAFARALTESFLAHHPQGQVFVLLVDEIEGGLVLAQEKFIAVLARDIGIPDFKQMAFRYTVTELNTAVKPFFIEYLFKHRGISKVCYFDPDICFYSPVDEIWSLLDRFGIILLPHLTGFLDDENQPDEAYILRAGTYNLGFIGLSKHDDLGSFLHWWQQKLLKQCVVDPVRGLFVDQRWIDLVPGIFSSVCIHRDPGCDVAYWNLKHRHVTQTPTGYQVNSSLLKFFHFSGISTDHVELISKYQNRYTLNDLDHLKPLFYDYRDRLLANGHESACRIKYAYGYFDNGVPIPDFARFLWRETDENCRRWPDPFKAEGRDSFFSWLNNPADDAPRRQPVLTRLSLELYRRRNDLQKAFPEVMNRDRRAYAQWYIESASSDHQFDDVFIKPVAESIVRGECIVDSPSHSRQSANEVDSQTVVSRLEPAGHFVNGRSIYFRLRRGLRRAGIPPFISPLFGPKIDSYLKSLIAPEHSAMEETGKAELAYPLKTQSMGGAQLPHGLNVVGYLSDETGVGEVARSILKALSKRSFPVAQTNVQGYLARRDDTSVLHLPNGNPYAFNLLNVNADQVPIVYEAMGSLFFLDRFNIGFWFWELSQFPEVWKNSFRYLDEVWVASTFVQCAVAQASPVPVVNVRVPILPPSPSPLTRAKLGLPTDKHLFLYVFDGLSFHERKNPLGLIRAYRMAFEPDFRHSALVIKTTNLNRNPELAHLLQQEMKSVSGILIDRYMTREELSGLFHLCDAYVSLHRSEGFGLTLAETMSLGKPVIATAYSSNMDFMTPANSYLVACRLVELERDYGPYQKGNLWAEPDLQQAAILMRCVMDNPEEARQKGQQAKQDMERLYGVQAVSNLIMSRLERIQGQPRRTKQTI